MTVQISSSRQASSKKSIEFTAGELEPVQHQEADTWPSDCAKVPGRSPRSYFMCTLLSWGKRPKILPQISSPTQNPCSGTMCSSKTWEFRGIGPCSERGYLCGRRDLNITTLATLVFVSELRSSKMPQSRGQNDVGVLLRRCSSSSSKAI